MRGLSVYRADSIAYQRAPNRDWVNANGGGADTKQTIAMARVTGSAASLEFNAAGNISSVTAYLNGNIYTADSFNSLSDTVVFAPITVGADDATIARLVVDRSGNFFGFNAPSNYMSYVGWNLIRSDEGLSKDSGKLTDATYHIGGNMIAGIETPNPDGADAFLSIDGNALFKGKGRGSYGDGGDVYATIFDVEADVQFNTGRISFKHYRYMRCG